MAMYNRRKEVGIMRCTNRHAHQKNRKNEIANNEQKSGPSMSTLADVTKHRRRHTQQPHRKRHAADNREGF